MAQGAKEDKHCPGSVAKGPLLPLRPFLVATCP